GRVGRGIATPSRVSSSLERPPGGRADYMHGAPARAIEATGPGGPRLQLLVEGSASSLECVPARESDKYRDPGDSSGAPERHNGHAPGSHVDASRRNTARRGNPTGPTERSMRAATPNCSAPD